MLRLDQSVIYEWKRISADLRFVSVTFVLLLPTQALRGPNDSDARLGKLVLGRHARVDTSAGIRRTPETTTMLSDLPLCPLQMPLYASQEVVIMIYARRRSKLALLDKLCRIAFPVALGPLLVALVARQRASPG